MENPDVVLEIELKDSKSVLSYKVCNRENNDSKSAVEFVQMVIAMFSNLKEEE